jgi:hypothetical protein
MRKTNTLMLTSLLVSALLLSPLWGKAYRFSLAEQSGLYGITLEPGEYSLQIFDDVASIYEGKKIIAVVEIRIEPLGICVPNSTCCCNGTLTEVRLPDKRVVFIEPDISSEIPVPITPPRSSD